MELLNTNTNFLGTLRFIGGFFICGKYFKNTPYWVLADIQNHLTFTSVFHRILDFKTGLDFYPGPFFYHELN
ncbi:hypothetical protein EGI32_12190 [Ferruginibacter sp. HRS2-29]|nr:hypothetical protein [Ferruginibacter sp. HRS2-29]